MRERIENVVITTTILVIGTAVISALITGYAIERGINYVIRSKNKAR